MTRRCRKTAISLLGAAMAAAPAGAGQYCLSPAGDDQAPGTRAEPWQTLAKANSALQAGDTLLMLPGTYAGSISPATPGKPGSPIVFRADGKSNTVAGCVAPGAWNIDRYPFVRLDYRIPPGTPVGLCVEPFRAPGMPRRILLGGTASRHGSEQDRSVAADTARVTLVDDDAWHTVTVDVRDVRTVVPDLQYLRLFEFHCYWKQDAEHEFRFDNFSILPVGATGE